MKQRINWIKKGHTAKTTRNKAKRNIKGGKTICNLQQRKSAHFAHIDRALGNEGNDQTWQKMSKRWLRELPGKEMQMALRHKKRCFILFKRRKWQWAMAGPGAHIHLQALWARLAAHPDSSAENPEHKPGSWASLKCSTFLELVLDSWNPRCSGRKAVWSLKGSWVLNQCQREGNGVEGAARCGR